MVIMSMPFSGPKNNKNKFDIKKINKQSKKLVPSRKHYQYYFSGKSANKNMMQANKEFLIF